MGPPSAIHVRVELPEDADALLERAQAVLDDLNRELDGRAELVDVPRHEVVLLGEEAQEDPAVGDGGSWLVLLAPPPGRPGVLGFAGTASANGASLAVLRERVEPLPEGDVGNLLGAFTRSEVRDPRVEERERSRLVELYAQREKQLSGSLPEWDAAFWRVPARQRAPKEFGVVGASVIGTRHLDQQALCDDCCGWLTVPGGVALAVADGAGFADRADEGSRLAILGALEVLAGWDGDWEPGLRAAAEGAQAKIEAAAEGAPSALSTTLLVAVWTARTLAVLQIGDGVVVARDGDGVHAVTRPDHGEHYNETVFVTSAERADRMQVVVQDAAGITDVALLSDGLQGLALELAQHRPVPGFFAPFFKLARGGSSQASCGKIAKFLASPRVCARTDDDKSLVVATRDVGGGT